MPPQTTRGLYPTAEDTAPQPAPVPAFGPLLPEPQPPPVRGLYPADPDQLTRVIDRARQTSPAAAARIFDLSVKTGFPPEVVGRNLAEVERQARRYDFDAVRFRQEAPKTAGWLTAEPAYAPLVQDDLPNLAGVERRLRPVVDPMQRVNDLIAIAQEWFPGAARPAAQAIGAGVQVAAAGVKVTRRLATGIFDAVEQSAWAALQASGDIGGALLGEWTGLPAVAEWAKANAQAAEATSHLIRGPREPNAIVEAVGGGVESAGANLAILAGQVLTAGGSTAAQAGARAATAMGVMTGLRAYPEARAAGRTPAEAVVYGALQGQIEYLTEVVPAATLFADLAKHSGIVKTLVRQYVAELPAEQAATLFGDLSTWVQLHPDRPLQAFVDERPSAALQTFVSTLAAVTLQTGLIHTIDRVANKPASQRALEDLHKSVAATTTKDHPTAMASFVARAAEGGATHVYVPADTFTEFHQSKGEDPAEMAAALTGDPEAYANAVKGGLAASDLAIPIATYMAQVGQGRDAFFEQELRLGEHAKNAREVHAEMTAAAAAGEPGAAPDATADARRQIYTRMVERLTATGRYQPRDVEATAAIYTSVYNALASRESDATGARVDPLALFERRSPTVVAEGRRTDPAAVAGRPGVVQSPVAGLPASRPQAGETGTQRRARRAGQVQALASQLLRAAQGLDPTVDPAVIKADVERRVARSEDRLEADRMRGRGQSLLRAIADRGGLWFGEQTEEAGELRDLAEGARDSTVTRSGAVRYPRGPATWNGIPGVFGERGQAPDVMAASLQVDFPHLSDDGQALLLEVRDAIAAAREDDAFPGTEELGIDTRTPWWLDLVEGVSDVSDMSDTPPPGSLGDAIETVLETVRRERDTIAGDGETGSNLDEPGAGEGDDSFAFDQAAPAEPVATLTGAEFAEGETDIKKLRRAAIAYYTRELQHGLRFVERPGFGVVTFTHTGKREVKSRSANPEKLRLIPAIPAIIEHGTYEGPRKPYRVKVKHPKIAAYHFFTGDVRLADRVVHVGVMVVEDNDGNKFYNINPDPDVLWAKKKARNDSPAQMGASEPSPQTPTDRLEQETGPEPAEDDDVTLEQSIHLDGGDVNVAILAQDDDVVAPRGWGSVEPGDSPKNLPPGKLTKGTYNPVTNVIRLLAGADRTTILHEGAHLFLEVMSDLAAEPTASDSVRADMQTLFDWWGYEGGLASWRALPSDARRDHHETFARGFEQYLGEGKAPTPALQALFAKFRTWMLGAYRTLRRLNVTLTPEVRAVFDRLVATDAEIATAEADAEVRTLFVTQPPGVSDVVWAGYRAQMQAASDEARAQLEAKVLADLTREEEVWWQEQRAEVRLEVAAEVQAEPVYRALAGMRGQLPDQAATPIARDALAAQFGRAVMRDLPLPWIYSATTGLPPDAVAELYDYESGAALIEAVLAAPDVDTVIDARTDAVMEARHGSLFHDPERLEVEARQAVTGEHRDQVVRKELAMLNTLRAAAAPSVRAEQGATRDARRAGAERLRTEMPDPETAQRLAAAQVAQLKVRDIRPDRFFGAARRASRLAITAAAKGDFDTAVTAKSNELYNLALYREALAARAAIEKAKDTFDRMFGADAPMAKRRNMDFVHAARAIAATLFWPERRLQTAEKALEAIKTNNDELYELLAEQIAAAQASGTELSAMTFEAFTAMRDTVDGLWEQSIRQQQMLIEGQLVDRADVKAALNHRLDQLGTPEKQARQTPIGRAFLGIRAWLRRVEHWVDHLDGGDINGVFRRYLWTPVAEATDRYRVAKGETVQQFLDLVKSIEATLVTGAIAAPELDYTFESKAALLHALGHSGNDSNLQKLVRGYEWGTLREDGTLDTTKWDAFLARAYADGTITKADMDFVQATWDLVASLKPQAQAAHRAMYGTYFSTIGDRAIETPFGSYRGGYLPAIVDPLAVAKQAARGEKELTDGNSATMFPTTGRGFTKARQEHYARPLALDLRLVPQHLDKVLRFIHLEPAVKDVGRLLFDFQMGERLAAYDPEASNEMLLPWLQRTAQQRVSNPPKGSGAQAIDRLFRTLRARTGLNMMAGNVVNTLQQFTGAMVAATKVKPRYLRNALWAFTTDHTAFVATIQEASPFMRTRTTAGTIEIQRQLEDLLLNPNTYQKARDWGQKHGYLLQGATQGMVDQITWAGAYEQATEGGFDHATAVRTADSAVRETQGSFAPEDVSRLEASMNFVRAFVMFYSYFNTMANLNGTLLATTARDLGLRKGAGRMLYIYTLGFMLPAVVAEVLRQAIGGWDDDDDDTHMDEAMAIFFGSQLRTAAAMLPGGILTAAINMATTETHFDDRISTSPAIAQLEGAGRTIFTLQAWDAVFNEGPKRRAVRDFIDLLGLVTGIPVGALKRPAGYAVDLYDGEADPETLGELAGGLISGRTPQ